MIKAVIFDYDGTLSSRYQLTYDFDRSFAEQYFSDKKGVELEVMIQDMILFDREGFDPHPNYLDEMMADTYGLDGEALASARKAYVKDHYCPQILRPGAKEVLKELRARGYRLGILTNGQIWWQMHKIKAMELDPLVDEIVISEAAGVKKPDPKIFYLMAEKLGVKPQECLYIGDNFSCDILGAHRAGMHYRWLCTNQEKFAHNVKKISTLQEVIDELDQSSDL